MKIVLLTTDTTHHRYYAWKLSERFPLTAIFEETRLLKAKFETSHAYEKEQVEYEQNSLLNGFEGGFSDISKHYIYENTNSQESVNKLNEISPDIILVFGTGKLKPPVFNSAKIACLNLHGGDPEEYRGLDTHLWAIHNEEYSKLITTLHHIDADLDTGDIVGQAVLDIPKGCKLHQLRAINTRVCVDLCIDALETFNTMGTINSRKQTRQGKYYSFMPTEIKSECLGKFEKHTAQ